MFSWLTSKRAPLRTNTSARASFEVCPVPRAMQNQLLGCTTTPFVMSRAAYFCVRLPMNVMLVMLFVAPGAPRTSVPSSTVTCANPPFVQAPVVSSHMTVRPSRLAFCGPLPSCCQPG